MFDVRKGTRYRAVLRWGLHQVQRAATRITRVGERHNIRWLTYNPLLFVYFLGRSLADAPGVVRVLEELFPRAERYLDAGAGSGGCAAWLNQRGHAVVACEHSSMGRWLTRCLGVASERFDLTQSAPAPAVVGRFDIAYSFEVAEHLPEALGQRLVEFIADRSDCVVFTAAVPGQGGMGHVNEQPPEYWVERFRASGLELDELLTERARSGFRREAVADWFANNAIVLRR